MKKNIPLLSLLFMLGIFQSQAQVSITHDTLYTLVTEGANDIVAHNFVTNNLPQQKTYRWVRNEVSMPDNWTSAVCDINQCYISSVDSIQFTLGPGATGTMDVHVYPSGSWEGNALIEILIKDINNPSNSVTGWFIFDSELNSTTEAHSFGFKVYPNPNNGLFTVEGENDKAACISVFSIVGERLVHTTIKNGDWYNISRLPAGTYLVQLSTKDGQPLGTKLMTKN